MSVPPRLVHEQAQALAARIAGNQKGDGTIQRATAINPMWLRRGGERRGRPCLAAGRSANGPCGSDIPQRRPPVLWALVQDGRSVQPLKQSTYSAIETDSAADSA